MEQGSKEWLDLRKSKIGSSDIPVIMGISPWKTAYKLWLEKTNRIKEGEATFFMKRGKEEEEMVRSMYTGMTSIDVIPSIKFHKEVDWAMASLDGLTLNGEHLVEIKVVSKGSYESIKRKGIPDYYLAQMQWQLLVSDAATADFFAYCADDGRTVLLKVVPDLEFQKEMLEKASEFYDCLINDYPPPISEKDYVLVDSEEMISASKEYRKVKEEQKSLDEKEKIIKQQLIDLTDEGNVFCPKGGIKISTIHKDGAVDLKPLCLKFAISEEVLNSFRKKPIVYRKIDIVA